jgi:hypothetical protein
MSAKGSRRDGPVNFRRGQSVAVRSLSEILATLDADGSLEGMPFMPEMAPFCGKTFRVFRRAERTCVEAVGIRSMENAVFLAGLRCDGSAHGGCQRGCLFFWKEDWLRPGESAVGRRQAVVGSGQSAVGSEEVELRLPTMKGDRFYCQSTELGCASGDLPPGKLRLFLHDMRIGELSVGRFVYFAWRALVNRGSRLVRGCPFYQVSGEQKKTVGAGLNLQAGELVEIKSLAEIQATLDAQGRNRGLSFEPEMALHCGRRYRVAMPLRTIISEETGKIVQLNDTIILDGLICRGICALNCPRANYFYWRDIWLKRVEA